MDLEFFFEVVCQGKIIDVLSQIIKDCRVNSLFHKNLIVWVISREI